MKVYMLVSGYKSVDNYNDYVKTPFATKELAAAAFERKLKYAFENDDVDGHSYKDCLASLIYDDGQFELFVEEFDVIQTEEEALADEEMQNS